MMCAPTHADTVALRSSARVVVLDAVTLGDVADLDGSYAEQFGSLSIEVNTRGSVDLAAVRSALDAADVNWGRISLQGLRCSVKIHRQRAGVDESDADATRTEDDGLDPGGPPTLRLRLARYISRWTDLPLDDLRLAFDDRDAELLGLTEFEYRFELKPISTPGSSRIPIAVRVWRGDEPIRRETVTIDVTRRIPVVILKRDVRRDQQLTADDLDVQTIWTSAGGPEPIATIEDVVGRVAVKRLLVGAILRRTDLDQPIIIRRGDPVDVKCIVGNLMLTHRARAQRDARLGEWVMLRLDGRKKTFRARVQGRGLAVVSIRTLSMQGDDQ
ncbi:MAG: flagellar basal body P-ring formation protein FlgA [Phycisphaerales bacterium]|nr:flagellar basal body P-ring formation protein FlgA [Phycisphaerales bacterium]